jgi:aryl-phospho-beta-D-glucosidase BglC (GH1 family)
MSYLHGGWGLKKDIKTGQLSHGPKEKWKLDLAVVKATIRFWRKQAGWPNNRRSYGRYKGWITLTLTLNKGNESHSSVRSLLGTAHTVTVNNLTESINQSIRSER